jgi:hypothetical protein
MTNPADNGWRSRVQALEPSEKREGWGAFTSKQGGGWGAFSSQETNDKRAQEQVVRANKERETTAASIEAAKEKRKYEEAINLGSQKAYPSLGGATGSVQKPKTTLDFKAVAEAAAAAQIEEDEKEKDDTLEWGEFTSAPAQKNSTVDNFLDNFDDDDEEEEDEEFNAEILSTRRRGDKGIW